MKRVVCCLCVFLGSMVCCAWPATAADAPTREARLAWWRDARFGMFIHWGPVSIKGTEISWSRGDPVPLDEYDNLYKQFNPTKFNADEWVKVAQDAGMKYIVITSKHHDGFCMFDTPLTDYCIIFCSTWARPPKARSRRPASSGSNRRAIG